MNMVRLRQWLKMGAITDPIEREQAVLVQIMMIGLSCMGLVSIPFGFLAAPTPGEILTNVLASSLTVIATALAVWLLRRDRFRMAIVLLSSVLLLELALFLALEGLRSSAWVLFAFAVPMTLTGLLAGRRSIILIMVLSIAIVTTIGLLELTTTGIIGVQKLFDDFVTLSYIMIQTTAYPPRSLAACTSPRLL